MTRNPTQRVPVLLTAAVFAAGATCSFTRGEEPAKATFDPYQGHETFNVYGGWVESVAFSPDGKLLAVGVVRDLHVFDLAAGKELYNLRQKVYTRHVEFSPDGTLLAFGGGDGIENTQIVVVEAATGREVRRMGEAGAEFRSFAFSPNGKTITAAAIDLVVAWETATGRKLDLTRPETGGFESAAFAPDGKTFAVYEIFAGSVVLWDAVNGTKVRAMEAPPLGRVGGVHMSFSADGKLLAAMGPDRTIHVWETATGKESRRFGRHASTAPLDSGSKSTFVALSPDGAALATTGMTGDDRLRVWDVTAEQEDFRCREQGMYFEAVAFSPDGKMLAAANHQAVHVFGEIPGRKLNRVGTSDGAAPPVPEIEKPIPDDLAWPKEKCDRLWADLGSGDRRRIDAAEQTLRSVPAQALQFLAKRLQPVPAAEGEQAAKWIAELDDDDFGKRDHAQKELSKVAASFEPALRAALAAKPSVEARNRLTELLAAVDAADLPESLTAELRALDLLEEIGTPQAQKVLHDIAGGASKVRLTEAALAGLRRLGKRLG
jgi:dipeptidyl aminopeptidase/acylaminoacyl peptidase